MPNKTILLNPQNWCMVVDATGNIAVADQPYALAQDVASALSTLEGEMYFDPAFGVPYYQQILGHSLPQSLINKYLESVALQVPNVVAAKFYLTSFDKGTVNGQLQFTDAAGIVNNVII